MKRWKIPYVILIGGFLVTANANARLDLSLTGIWNFSDFFLETVTGETLRSTHYVPRSGFGFGFQLDYRFHPKAGLEGGASILTRSFDEDPDEQTKVNITYAEVPFLFRFWPYEFISVGLGPYLAYVLGTVSVDSIGVGGQESNENVPARDFGIKKFDFGLVASLRGTYPLAKDVDAVLGTRWLHGLRNVSAQDGGTARFSAIQLLLGVRLQNQ